MRQGAVFYNGRLAGLLTENSRNDYVFRYDDLYFNDTRMPSISLTIPKNQQEIHSRYLFPFFYNMLAEGVNKNLQIRQLKIDEEDAFGLLLATAGADTIGAITVKPAH